MRNTNRVQLHPETAFSSKLFAPLTLECSLMDFLTARLDTGFNPVHISAFNVGKESSDPRVICLIRNLQLCCLEEGTTEGPETVL